jgi:hypothetical protein
MTDHESWHGVEAFEVEEALSNKPKIRRAEKGKRKERRRYGNK